MIPREPRKWNKFSNLSIYGTEIPIDMRFSVCERKFDQILGNQK